MTPKHTPESNDTDPLDEFAEIAFSRLEEVDGDPSRLPKPLATLVIVVSAQGVIDNGGLEYFYSADFPGAPPYSLFAEAYAEIGAPRAARAITESAASFGIAHPHLDLDHRLGVLADAGPELSAAHADAFLDIYKKLLEYCLRNEASFDRVAPPAKPAGPAKTSKPGQSPKSGKKPPRNR